MSRSVPLSKAIAQTREKLPALPDNTTRQVHLLQLINEYTGSTFSGLNLNDPLGRMLGFVAWPLPPERIKLLQEFTPALSAVILASPIHQWLWDHGPNVAFGLPDALFHATQAYRTAYKHANMHHVAFYHYPADAQGNLVIVCISRSDRAFSLAEIGALQTICDEFGETLDDLEAGVPMGPRHSTVADHVVELDGQLRPKSVSAYAGGLISLFYGPLREGGTILPDLLIEEITYYRSQYHWTLLPAERGEFFAFTKRNLGRTLCLSIQSDQCGGSRLTVYEDISQLKRLRALKDICRGLPRDRYAMFGACLAVLDGVQDDKEIQRRAGLAALKATSAARVVSKARSIVAAL